MLLWLPENRLYQVPGQPIDGLVELITIDIIPQNITSGEIVLSNSEEIKEPTISGEIIHEEEPEVPIPSLQGGEIKYVS